MFQALCEQFKQENEPIHEIDIANDSAIGLGDSIGEIIDTADEETEQTDQDQTEPNQTEPNQTEPLKTEQTKQSDNKKEPKPHRPCPYCGVPQSVLTRHLKLKHKDKPAVIEAMNKKEKSERDKAFDLLKKEGIFLQNQKEMEKEKPTFMRERKAKHEEEVKVEDVVVCASCHGTYSKSYKSRHQLDCGKTSGQVMIPMVPVKDLVITQYADDFKKVLNKMIIDDVSTLAKTDPYILVVGARIFNGNKCKEEKLYETEKRVRSVMRLLSRLLIQFRISYGEQIDLSYLYNRLHLSHLRFAIEALSENESEMKSGLKVQIQNVIKQGAKILEAHFLVEGQTKLAENVCDFVKVFHLVENEIFNGALYLIKQKRNKATRKPANLPDEELVQDLRKYLLDTMKKENFIFKEPQSCYVEVRDATCARLVMFNGRRGLLSLSFEKCFYKLFCHNMILSWYF